MKLVLHSFVAALMLAAVGCGSYIQVEGREATYVDVPVGYERYPHYDYHGVAVYEINGHYYREYNRRWIVYRERPHDLVVRADVRVR